MLFIMLIIRQIFITTLQFGFFEAIGLLQLKISWCKIRYTGEQKTPLGNAKKNHTFLVICVLFRSLAHSYPPAARGLLQTRHTSTHM